MLAVQDTLDAERKTFVGGQSFRYTGTLLFYDAKKGMGKVMMDDGYVLLGEDKKVPKELLVEAPEVNVGGKRPKSMQNLKVEFGIWKSKTGQCKVYNMSLPGGATMTWDNAHQRKMASQELFSGTVSQWWWKQGWGFIMPHSLSTAKFPALVKTKLQEMQAAARRKSGSSKEVPQLLLLP